MLFRDELTPLSWCAHNSITFRAFQSAGARFPSIHQLDVGCGADWSLLHMQADGLKEFMTAADPDLIKFYLALEHNLFPTIASAWQFLSTRFLDIPFTSAPAQCNHRDSMAHASPLTVQLHTCKSSRSARFLHPWKERNEQGTRKGGL